MNLDPKQIIEMLGVMDNLAAGNMDGASEHLAKLGGPVVHEQSSLRVVAQDRTPDNPRSL